MTGKADDAAHRPERARRKKQMTQISQRKGGLL